MMKLADMTVTGFADTVASDAPAPGGGSCAALYGSIGAALTAMVGGLTQGRKKYAEYAEHAAEVEKKGNELKTRLLDVMDRDTEAFNVVSAAFGMPKATDEEKAARSAAIQEGLKGCTKTPMEMMELIDETLTLAQSLLGRFNDTSASDLGVAFLSLKAGIQGAWLNVLINVGSLKDQEFAAEYRAKGEALLAHALPLADECYAEIVKLIGSDVLPDSQKVVIETARVIRTGFLQQNAFHKNDTYVPLDKQMWMMEAILHLYDRAVELVDKGVPVSAMAEAGLFDKLVKVKYEIPNDKPEMFGEYNKELDDMCAQLLAKQTPAAG